MYRYLLIGLGCLMASWFATRVDGGQKPDDNSLLMPVNLAVNTPDDEDEPHVADAGLTLYFNRRQNSKDDIFFVRRRALNLPWPAKAARIEDYVTTASDDRSVFATQGAYPHFLYFATKKDEKSKNFDLYVAVKHGTGKAWSAPTPVMNVNTPDDELHPWISADGKSLYFTRRVKGREQVWVARRSNTRGPQGWEEPTQVPLPEEFHHVTLTPDGKTMYLQGPLDDGRWGLFVCTLTGKQWSKPEPLKQLNHPKSKIGDRAPALSRDGQILYFASDRPGGKGGLDLWSIPTRSLLGK